MGLPIFFFASIKLYSRHELAVLSSIETFQIQSLDTSKVRFNRTKGGLAKIATRNP